MTIIYKESKFTKLIPLFLKFASCKDKNSGKIPRNKNVVT